MRSDTNTTRARLVDLPLELQLSILQYLPYPDHLSLRLTNTYFNTHEKFITTRSDRVSWLISRSVNGLSLPRSARCRWSSDQEFVSNAEVKQIIRRRRLHQECEVHDDQGCLLVPGYLCDGLQAICASPYGLFGTGSAHRVVKALNLVCSPVLPLLQLNRQHQPAGIWWIVTVFVIVCAVVLFHT